MRHFFFSKIAFPSLNRNTFFAHLQAGTYASSVDLSQRQTISDLLNIHLSDALDSGISSCPLGLCLG